MRWWRGISRKSSEIALTDACSGDPMNVRRNPTPGPISHTDTSLIAMKTPMIAKKRTEAIAAASRPGIGIAMCGRSPWYGADVQNTVVTTVFADHLRARWLEESSQ
jgi:hypothetical protein